MQGPWSKTYILDKSGYKYLHPKQFEELFGTEKEELATAILTHLQKENPDRYKFNCNLSLSADTVVIQTKDAIADLEAVKNELTASFTLNSFPAVILIQPNRTTLLQLKDVTVPYMDLVFPTQTTSPVIQPQDNVKKDTQTSVQPTNGIASEQSEMNPIEIIVSGLFGALLGWLVSVVHARETAKINSKKLRIKFQPIAGQYIWQLEQNGRATDRIISKADIEYQADNKLIIELTTFIALPGGHDFTPDEIQIWTGEIAMDSIRNGLIVWEYRKPERLIGTNGFKRIIIDKDLNGISLVGESGYGVEKMKRNKISSD